MNEADIELARRLREEKTQEEVEYKLGLVERIGEDVFAEGTVFKFTKGFQGSPIQYSYAVIKTNELWYTTGPRSPKGYTWDELVLWLVSGTPATNLVEMREWESKSSSEQ